MSVESKSTLINCDTTNCENKTTVPTHTRRTALENMNWTARLAGDWEYHYCPDHRPWLKVEGSLLSCPQCACVVDEAQYQRHMTAVHPVTC